MRAIVLSFVVLSSSAWAQATRDEAAPVAKSEAARAVEAAAIARKAAESYTIREEGETLKLEPKSLLQWANPVSGSFHGSVYVWTHKGRPEVVASIYKWYSATPHLGVEFHSLASAPVTAERGTARDWAPERAGVELKPIPEAPAPADSPAQRLRQMRALAREFTATETDRKEVTRELRLLSQPLYRYATTEGSVLDGALFTFSEGTDTEIIMLIEARRGERGIVWNYALARMNSVAMRVLYRKQEVWSVLTIPWEQAQDPREPYVLITFKPGQGVNPLGD